MTADTAASSHRYPTNAIAGDYGRAALGMALTLGPLAFVNPASIVVYLLGGLGTLFLVFGLRTVLRHTARVEVSAEEIRVKGPVPAVLRWQDLDAMTLSYYSTRRDRGEGWMQLKLKSAGRTLKFDSSISDFATIARHAVVAARANGVALNDRTLANTTALGIAVDTGGGAATGD
ncbi:MAG: hypothetical protein ACE5LF_00975 [Alphaproteobacteria bacterium]